MHPCCFDFLARILNVSHVIQIHENGIFRRIKIYKIHNGYKMV